MKVLNKGVVYFSDGLHLVQFMLTFDVVHYATKVICISGEVTLQIIRGL